MSREEFGGSVRRPSGRSRARSSTERAPAVQLRMRRTGTGRRAWIMFLASAAILVLLCLEGIVYCVRNFTGEGSSDPTTIEAVRHEMAELNLPAGYLPAVYGRLGEFRGVAYMNPETNARILLFEVVANMRDPKVAPSNLLQGRQRIPSQRRTRCSTSNPIPSGFASKGKNAHSSSAKGSIPELATRAAASRVPSREKVDRRQSKSTWMKLHITKAKLSQCSREFGKELRGARTARSGGN